MRIILDEMFPATVAEQLRKRGHDAVAVAERPDLRGQPDDVIFSSAQSEERCIVTENVADYRMLAFGALHAGRSHCGVVFTSDRRFPRHDPRTLGRLVAALDRLMSSEVEASGLEHWLS